MNNVRALFKNYSELWQNDVAHVYFICCRDRNSSKAAKRPQQEAAIYVRFEDAKAELRLRVAEGGNSEEEGGPE